ncbi:claudin-15-like [Scleropages formosus]|uniref:Claudin-15-like n=1 Tax=Scleropages formosus TaxID=113540 RepID=A0A0P7TED5_SCLFO|nr:claudin-15-like [Scleropages formosus]
MDPTVEVVALLLGFLGWVMVGVALPNRYWKVSTVDGNVITTSTIYENLWMSCATDSTGASRALMITSVVLGTIGLVATLIGMQCSKAAGDNYTLKGRIAGTGGLCFLLQGLCTMISVSWYAFNITQEFFDPYYPGVRQVPQSPPPPQLPARFAPHVFTATLSLSGRYEIGEGLYIGWCSGTLALIGGACLLCACRLRTSEKYPLPYQNTRGTAYSAQSHRKVPSTYDRNAYV